MGVVLLPHQDLLLLHHQLPLHPHPVDVDLLNGKEIIGVMMKTTMLNVLLMEETAVVIMSRLPTVKSVNVRKEPQLLLLLPQLQPPHQQMEHQEDASSLNGKEMDIVMMATTMLNVLLMVEIAVVMMSTPLTAKPVNAKKVNVKHQYGKEMVGVMMATTILDVNGTEVIAVEMM